MSEDLFNSEKIDELIFWVRYPVWKTFLVDLKTTLRDDVDKLVYELSNGKNSTRDIAQIATKMGKKISNVTVANMWQRWALIPLVIPARTSGRYRKVVSLKLVGIELPTIESDSKQGVVNNE
ncbi:MAG: hypothetical protein ABSB10_04610 [Candidatus Bathyarchaeia archaeon]|jgi:hypothetical protein